MSDTGIKIPKRSMSATAVNAGLESISFLMLFVSQISFFSTILNNIAVRPICLLTLYA